LCHRWLQVNSNIHLISPTITIIIIIIIIIISLLEFSSNSCIKVMMCVCSHKVPICNRQKVMTHNQYATAND